MARNRQSPAETILNFFSTAPIDTAQVVLDLAKAAVKARQPQAAPRKNAPKKKKEATVVAPSDPAGETE